MKNITITLTEQEARIVMDALLTEGNGYGKRSRECREHGGTHWKN